MKVVSSELGRSSYLFVPDEVRPAGGVYVQESVRLICERYGFGGLPPLQEALNSPIKFTHGRLIGGSKKLNISELVIYSNAIQASAANTADADYIVDDILAWAKSTLGYREPQTKLPRLYESNLVVDFERQVDRLLYPFKALQSELQKALAATYGLQLPIAITSFGIGADPLSVAGQLPPPIPGVLKPELGLVRRINHPYSENRFFSSAPFQTDVHIALLEQFEAALSSKGTESGN